MPSRITSVLIFVFWLACMSWLFIREVWPRLISGDPPRFSIDRMDNTRRNVHPIAWTATQKSGDVERHYTVATRVEWDAESETYSFRSLMEPYRTSAPNAASALERLGTIYRVDAEGRMYAFDAEATFTRLGVRQTAFYDGTVQGSDCSVSWSVTAKREMNRGVAEVGVSRTGTVLLPLHPLPRIRDLTSGRRWGLPMFNPLAVPLAPGTSPKFVWVNAQVRDAAEVLEWNRKQVSCRVIEYDGDEVHGSVWVEEDDGARVLQIEFRLGDDEWTITRK